MDVDRSLKMRRGACSKESTYPAAWIGKVHSRSGSSIRGKLAEVLNSIEYHADDISCIIHVSALRKKHQSSYVKDHCRCLGSMLLAAGAVGLALLSSQRNPTISSLQVRTSILHRPFLLAKAEIVSWGTPSSLLILP